MSPSDYTHALVRQPSPRYASAYVPHGISISDEQTRQQHRDYVRALTSAGLAVQALPPHPSHHDCVFIEDTAVIVARRALVTFLNERRRGEELDVLAWLNDNDFEIEAVVGDARIEGGDVLHLEDVTVVGRSNRTNDGGIDWLRRYMRPAGHEVIAIPVERCLHLKSAMTYLGDRTVLVSPALLDIDLPAGYTRIDVAPAEPNAGNVLRVRKTLMYARNFPETAERLRPFAADHGLELVEVDISQAQLGDGALTCQSLLW
jgi:dimethylargininase